MSSTLSDFFASTTASVARGFSGVQASLTLRPSTLPTSGAGKAAPSDVTFALVKVEVNVNL